MLVSVGNFMVTPLLALYLHVVLHESGARIGVVLTVLITTQQALPAVTGPLADRVGLRRALVAGLLARSAGYLGFAFGSGLPLLVGCAALAGLGGAAFTPAAKAMVALAAGERRLEAFALRSVAVNVGAAAGPLVGGLLFGHFRLVFVGAVAIYVAFLALFVRRVPSEPERGGDAPRVSWLPRELFRDRALLAVTGFSVGFWFLYTQFTFTVPLYAADRFDLTGRIGLLFALNATLVLALQYTAVARLTPRLGSWRVLALGMLVAGGGFAALAAIPASGALLLFTVLFSLGELVVVPTLDNVGSLLAPKASLAGYLGVVSVGWAIGGLVGNLAGGALYSLAHDSGAYWPFWLLDAGLGVVTAAGFARLGSAYSWRAK